MDNYTRSRFIQAIKKFNCKDFFECHEILEDIWFESRDDGSRDFYQGLLHIAVAFYHLNKNNNIKGAMLQLEKASGRLMSYPKNYNDIDTEKLLKQVSVINKNLAKDKLPARFPKINLL